MADPVRFLARLKAFFSKNKPEADNTGNTVRTEPDRGCLDPIQEDVIGGGFRLPLDIARKFNAYAEAAMPNEIGGLLRIQNIEGVFTVIDLAILKQHACATYFEFEEEAQAQFVMDLALNGRGDEIPEWCGLIHSHPHMDPIMSGTDVKNLRLVAGTSHGFSVICSAWTDPNRNYYAVNYARVENDGVVMLDNMRIPEDLAGTETTPEEQRAILDEVNDKVGSMTTGYGRSRKVTAEAIAYEPPMFDSEGDVYVFTSERGINLEWLLTEEEIEMAEDAFMRASSQPMLWYMLDRSSLALDEADDILSAVASMPSYSSQDEVMIQAVVDKLSNEIDRLAAI